MKPIQIDYERGGKQKDIYEEAEVMKVPCPLCGKDEYKEIYKERGVLGVVECARCKLIYVNPRLKNPEEVYWGDAEKYFKEARLIFEGKATHHRDINYLEDLRLIHRYKPAGNFLDVGTNVGFFLNNAKKWKGWNLYGVEPSPSLSELAREYFALNIKTAFLEDAGFERNFFDVVTMTDVFEHIANPAKILNEIRRILKPDGVLFIKVPNGLFNLFKFRMAKLIGKLRNYDIFDSYEHVIHYSNKTLKEMLDKYGFQVVKVKIGKPIQLPVWHKYVGHYYQYPSPWFLDYKRQTVRSLLYFLSKIEFYLGGKNIGYFAPNIIAIARKNDL
ncbi:MAG: class I SAM-dependent methyltransferase [Candidatus Omnitrophica bacterium]|nr:class I SAM-dependent methyltransferase [Candidatus Omnitrophota bacterium]MDD5591902.1 class I SAM-dependent methyltransferase [Candidatus Omnitrophota bacterium]